MRDTFKVLKCAIVVAREDHDCFDCAEGIKAGQKYERASCVGGGRAFRRKRCLTCLEEIAMFDAIAAKNKPAEGQNKQEAM
jgi:hypothetical protein